MSIQNDEQLIQAHEQLGRLQRILATLKRDLGETNKVGFRLMAEGPLEDIRRLRESIVEYTGEELLEKIEVDFRFRLVGSTIKWRDTPIGVIAAYFQALRSGVRALAASADIEASAYLAKTDLKLASELTLVDLLPGSLDVGLRLPEPNMGQLDVFQNQQVSPAKIAVTDFLNCAVWVAGDFAVSELESHFPNTRRRRAVLRALKPFVPRRSGAVESVVVYGPMVPIPSEVTLTRHAVDRIRLAYETAISEREFSFEGEIREIDLDKRAFQLRKVEAVGNVSCEFPQAIDKIARNLLGRRVSVVGTRTEEVDGPLKGKLVVSEILPIESDNE